MVKTEVCETIVVHEEAVRKAKSKQPDGAAAADLAEFFKTFGDATRIKIISALLETELCVCDLSCVIQISQSAVSHQLRLLRQARLVKYRRDGKTVYYSLDDFHIAEIMKQGLNHINHL